MFELMGRSMVRVGAVMALLVCAACHTDKVGDMQTEAGVTKESQTDRPATHEVVAKYVQKDLRRNRAGYKYYAEKYYMFFRNGKVLPFDETCDYSEHLLYFVCLKYFRDDFSDYLDSVDPDSEFFGIRNLSSRQLSFFEQSLPYLHDVPVRDTTIRVEGYNITDALNYTYSRAKDDLSSWRLVDSDSGCRTFCYRHQCDSPEYRLVLRKEEGSGALILVP